MRKWKPTKAQRKEFAQKMQDPEYEKAYLQRKEKRAASRRKNSDYDYSSAGGSFVPTRIQYQLATVILEQSKDSNLRHSARIVTSGYGNNEKVHHDHIHVVNEFGRNNYFKKTEVCKKEII